MRLDLEVGGPRSYSIGLWDLSVETGGGRVPIRVKEAARCTVMTEEEERELDLEG